MGVLRRGDPRETSRSEGFVLSAKRPGKTQVAEIQLPRQEDDIAASVDLILLIISDHCSRA